MTNGNTQNLADRIAQLLQENEKGSDSDFLRASLEKINQRLDTIEAQITQQNSAPQTAAIPNPKSFHVSQEKFKSLEELADEIIAGMQNEKACPYEPTGKPCDHCAMCSSRGF
jgi:Arc/MetJ-type ribon-helix-helix transcriptional regulator